MMTKHYKDAAGAFFGYEEDDEIPQGLIELTEKELAELSAPSPRVKREAALRMLSYITSAGNAIQIRPQDEPYISGAIRRMERLGETSVEWLLADNTWATLTLEELQEAQAAQEDAVATIFATYKAATDA